MCFLHVQLWSLGRFFITSTDGVSRCVIGKNHDQAVFREVSQQVVNEEQEQSRTQNRSLQNSKLQF